MARHVIQRLILMVGTLIGVLTVTCPGVSVTR